MTLKPPESEEAWEECMSAYMDGEMTADEIIEFERIVGSDPIRISQLEALRETSALLHAWEIDAPAPDKAFLKNIRELKQPERLSAWRSWFGSLRLKPALMSFLIGIIAGILFMTLIDSGNMPETTYAPKIKVTAFETAISPAQAHMLLEVEELMAKVLTELDQRNIEGALEYLNELNAKYPESRALRELYENRTMRLLQKGVRLASN